MTMAITQLEAFLAGPYVQLFSQPLLFIIILVLLNAYMLISRLEFGAILVFNLAILIWLSISGFAGLMGNVIIAILLVIGLLFLVMKRGLISS